ncbi:unnamed protein product [Adineta ricciae]|uniref:Metalloendopeptidase n=1 Tax=Adineta ricciae TaxID=249248 RepID=A0A815H662_ADIRI|nr:unnamed protein product [Adineta ricciae]
MNWICDILIVWFCLMYKSYGMPLVDERDWRVFIQSDLDVEDDTVFIQQQKIKSNEIMIQSRGVAVQINPRWPAGVIPYYIEPSFSDAHRHLIELAMKQIEENTKVDDKSCIQFKRQSQYELPYVHIVNGTGCSSTIGQGWGYKRVMLEHSSTSSCMDIGIILHELLHTLGFGHEQLRPDRDSYLQIRWENIQEDKFAKFKRYEAQQAYDLDTPYDYGSVMHYPLDAYSKNGSLTMVPTKNISVIVGQPFNLTSIDILEIQRYYQCVPFGSTTTTTPKSCAITCSTPCFFIFTLVLSILEMQL